MFQEHLALVDAVGVVKKNILIINDLIMKVRIKNPIWGVPISFLDKYCPEQFKIVALGNSRENFTPNKDYINPKKHMSNGKISNGNAINCVLAINVTKVPTTTYYTSDNSNYIIAPYARILIKSL